MVLDISKAVQPKTNKWPRNEGLLMGIEKSKSSKYDVSKYALDEQPLHTHKLT